MIFFKIYIFIFLFCNYDALKSRGTTPKAATQAARSEHNPTTHVKSRVDDGCLNPDSVSGKLSVKNTSSFNCFPFNPSLSCFFKMTPTYGVFV